MDTIILPCLKLILSFLAVDPFVQGLMILFLTSANQVDVLVAKAQRRQLGICEKCGGVNSPGSCSERECPLKQSVSGVKEEGTR
jgi:hypothetical protein